MDIAQNQVTVGNGLDNAAVQTHVYITALIVLLLLPGAFGSGWARSKWHRYFGAIAVTVALCAQLIAPSTSDLAALPTSTAPSIFITIKTVLVLLICLQGMLGVVLALTSDPDGRRDEAVDTPAVHSTPRPLRTTGEDTSYSNLNNSAPGGASASAAAAAEGRPMPQSEPPAPGHPWQARRLQPLRSAALLVHGLLGMFLPNLGFIYLFVSLDFTFGMCQHGRQLQCLAHIGLSSAGTPIGIITLMNALYPHSRLLVLVWQRLKAPTVTDEEAESLLQNYPPLHPPSSDPETALELGLQAAIQGLSAHAEHKPQPGSQVGQHTSGGDGLQFRGEVLPGAGRRRSGGGAWTPPDPVVSHVLPVDKHLRSSAPWAGVVWDMSSAFIIYVALPAAAAVVASNAAIVSGALTVGGAAGNGTAPTDMDMHRGLRTLHEMEMEGGGSDSAGAPPIEAAAPAGHASHSDVQHVMLGVIGVACFAAELVLRAGSPAVRSGVDRGAWVVPRICFYIAVGFAMGLHHQHSVTAAKFHLVAGQFLAAAGVVLLLEAALGNMIRLPEVQRGASLLAEGKGQTHDLGSGRFARSVMLVGTSPAAGRLLVLQRVFGLLRGVLLLFSCMMFLGSSDSSQQLGLFLLPAAWGPGLFFTLTVITLMWWMALASCVQTGAAKPHWPSVRKHAAKEVSEGGWHRLRPVLCCCV